MAKAIRQNPLRFTVTIALGRTKGKAIVTCHSCQTEAFKFGVQNGFQRYRCKTCKKTFSDIPTKPLGDLRVEPEKAHLIIRLLCEGTGVRACERLAGVNRRTVLNVLEVAGRKCQQLLDSKIKNLNASFVSIDETYSFVGCLQQNTEKTDRVRGDQYAFLAINQDTKLIIHSLLGKRTGENADMFLAGFKSRIAGRFQLTSDQFAPYCGSYSGVFRVFRESIDYGYEVKIFGRKASLYQHKTRRENPREILVCKRIPVIGNPVRHRMTTNISERCNLSVRLFNRRFTRKTLGYSKTLRNHKLALSLQIAHFNFCRTHSALKITATETEPAQERTPAMAQGLTDHAWSIEELLTGS